MLAKTITVLFVSLQQLNRDTYFDIWKYSPEAAAPAATGGEQHILFN